MKTLPLNKWSKMALAISLTFSTQAFAAEQRPLQVTDVMKFKEIKKPTLTDNGEWLSYTAQMDRGDSSFHVINTDGKTRFDVELGNGGQVSADGKYAAVLVKPSLLSNEQASKKEKKDLKSNLTVINLSTGAEQVFEAVEDYQLSDTGGFVAFSQKQEDKTEDADAAKDKADDSKAEAKNDENDVALHNKKRIKYNLTVVNLQDSSSQIIEDVDNFSFSGKRAVLVYSVSVEDGSNNSLKAINLNGNKSFTIVNQGSSSFDHLSWSHNGDKLAFIEGDFSKKDDSRRHKLKIWNSDKNSIKTVKTSTEQQQKWFISSTNKLTWSADDERLFFGFKPVIAKPEEIDSKPEDQADLYNVDKIVAKRNLQIWHGNDPLIKTNEKFQYNRDKKAFYTAVYHVDDNELVRLANKDIFNVVASNNKNAVLGQTDLNYRRIRTWEGFFSDFYIVDLEDGEKHLVVEKLSSYTPVKLSESGRYAAYYQDGHYWAYDSDKKRRVNLTKNIDVSFANEDHDYPSAAPGYGIAGWLADDEGVLVYDKFDIWLLAADGDDSQCLTCSLGRPNNLQFRINDLDKDNDIIDEDTTLLLTSYNDDKKNFGFYQLSLGQDKAPVKLVEDNKKYKFIGKAKDADKIIFSREDFQEFPDLWVSDLNPANGKKLTDVNPQVDDFLWGQPELVDWRSSNGERHQGILIKPANYVEGVQYPVVVYYYRLFSQRMYEFNQMKVNHRPNFPLYSSNGYAIFLPDVHFDVGTPGHSTNKSILPGLQKIIDMGVADPNAIGLHGHSWSGYQTLHSITETNMFAAAVSGAPVANMTSAYSGIRLGTGLARQFQYEMGQSRIGASMFERRDLYIENSPVFFADRITTPLLMQFGDIDDAVPWQQGVEMYLAMRRLDKEVILLQYEGEPHHLKKYPNKVDYTIKMMQYFDHYLKGKPAAEWMTQGEAYRDKKAD
ncbi:prolyl oligopeptidase family serine peptidase [Thalassotalea sp. Y01]|uniref:S9 family peptidase n=1 Tax=Thalassotalea sp. Y01 TaxID=2729613 RepID=UPI00145D2537|nr:prolyl oligopeptidase family serine peptidase [Thalassotalea sp. Y01]NMP17731.1 S9 family peptidase [Thalassotalea sp. Y01]